jgi:hypothetical protein
LITAASVPGIEIGLKHEAIQPSDWLRLAIKGEHLYVAHRATLGSMPQLARGHERKDLGVPGRFLKP